jgi:four helix bundle protein
MEYGTRFHDILKKKSDEFAFSVYIVTKNFPKDEIYGMTSQLRRASLPVILNYIEGYTRVGDKQHKNFLQMSYGSLKESKYLIYFAYREKYINGKEYEKLIKLSEELGATPWKTIQGIKDKE